MGKYLVIWTINKEYITADPEENNKMIKMLNSLVKQGFQMGLKDWGMFANTMEGFYIFEGEFNDLVVGIKLAAPFVETVEVQQFLDLDEAGKNQKEAMELIKNMRPS